MYKDMESHLECSQQDHMDLLLVALLKERKHNQENDRTVKQLEEDNELLTKEIERMKKILCTLPKPEESMKMISFISPIIEKKCFEPDFLCFVWKISNPGLLYERIVTDSKCILCSDICFTGEKGYHIGVFFTRTESDPLKPTKSFRSRKPDPLKLSLYLQITQGPHDSILPWPVAIYVQASIRNKDSSKNFSRAITLSSQKPVNSELNTKEGSLMITMAADVGFQLANGFIIDDNLYFDIRVSKYSAN